MTYKDVSSTSSFDHNELANSNILLFKISVFFSTWGECFVRVLFAQSAGGENVVLYVHSRVVWVRHVHLALWNSKEQSLVELFSRKST